MDRGSRTARPQSRPVKGDVKAENDEKNDFGFFANFESLNLPLHETISLLLGKCREIFFMAR